jgi:hypothetical protein
LKLRFAELADLHSLELPLGNVTLQGASINNAKKVEVISLNQFGSQSLRLNN